MGETESVWLDMCYNHRELLEHMLDRSGIKYWSEAEFLWTLAGEKDQRHIVIFIFDDIGRLEEVEISK